MPDLKTVNDAAGLLAQAEERIGKHVRFVPAQPNHWHAVFSGGGGFRLEWSGPWRRLVMTAALGVPPAAGERSALNLALTYNALWRQIGNLRIARDREDGELILIGELGSAHAQPAIFGVALLHFESLRRWWGEALSHARDPISRPPPPPNLWAGRV
jgi:hypothetical protein